MVGLTDSTTFVDVASSRPVTASSTTSANSRNDLLLVDLAWAQLDASHAEAELEIGRLHGEEDESVSELALASLFEEEDNWWQAL